ncbi:unnamed protein product [Schistocephalus solidus]|uniref:Hexosyltransferase n=1 Tax=Schistocephalus solidus TaxID=70667 RepID=A0A183T1P7_SCHSO|nr:unnamed protein product [Schistocephalus solidus]
MRTDLVKVNDLQKKRPAQARCLEYVVTHTFVHRQVRAISTWVYSSHFSLALLSFVRGARRLRMALVGRVVVKTLLNSIFPDIQFTMEEEVNNQLPLLDIQVTKLADGKIRTTVYRKATNTMRILHFKNIDKEQETYGEIVQQDFIDHYDNNTYKAIMGLKWASAYCPQANFVVSLDDDFYANPRLLNQLLDRRTALLINQPYQLVGHVYENASPYRTWFSKWYVSLADYPWTHWPPYPAAGAYVTSMQLIRLMALEADHVAYLRFDDVFIGFLALKLNVQPEHDDRFMLSTRTCRIELHKAIACHTVGSPSTVLWLWEHRLDHNRRRLS